MWMYVSFHKRQRRESLRRESWGLRVGFYFSIFKIRCRGVVCFCRCSVQFLCTWCLDQMGDAGSVMPTFRNTLIIFQQSEHFKIVKLEEVYELLFLITLQILQPLTYMYTVWVCFKPRKKALIWAQFSLRWSLQCQLCPYHWASL